MYGSARSNVTSPEAFAAVALNARATGAAAAVCASAAVERRSSIILARAGPYAFLFDTNCAVGAPRADRISAQVRKRGVSTNDATASDAKSWIGQKKTHTHPHTHTTKNQTNTFPTKSAIGRPPSANKHPDHCQGWGEQQRLKNRFSSNP